MSKFVKWASIDSFHHVNRRIKKFWLEENRPTIKYRPKIKIHGTNAAIRITPDGTVIAQKRTATITPGEGDNFGFASWVRENEEFWKRLGNGSSDVIVYGEWAGPGVQKSVAVSDIPHRCFFVFSILVIEDYLIQEPDIITHSLRGVTKVELPHDVKVLPWHGPEIEIPFSLMSKMQEIVDDINTDILAIEREDPYIAREFDISGVGEGLVYSVSTKNGSFNGVTRQNYSELSFKAKGEKHQVSCKPKAVQISPEVAENIKVFVDTHLTENRLQQGLQEVMDGHPNVKNMGDFLKWIGQDVKREAEPELEAAELDWKKVSKVVTARARTWLIERHQQL